MAELNNTRHGERSVNGELLAQANDCNRHNHPISETSHSSQVSHELENALLSHQRSCSLNTVETVEGGYV